MSAKDFSTEWSSSTLLSKCSDSFRWAIFKSLDGENQSCDLWDHRILLLIIYGDM